MLRYTRNYILKLKRIKMEQLFFYRFFSLEVGGALAMVIFTASHNRF